MEWFAYNNVKFKPIFLRQFLLKNGKKILWVGLIRHERAVAKILFKNSEVLGISINNKSIETDSVTLVSRGFEANNDLRKLYIRKDCYAAKIRALPS